MTCTNNTHEAFTATSHSAAHIVHAETVCSAIKYDRPLSLEELDAAYDDVDEVMKLDPQESLEECTRILGIIVKKRHPFVAAP